MQIHLIVASIVLLIAECTLSLYDHSYCSMSASQLSLYLMLFAVILNIIANVNERYVDTALIAVVTMLILFMNSESTGHKYVAMDHTDYVTASHVTWNIVLIEYLLFLGFCLPI